MLEPSVLDGIGWKVRGDFVAPDSHERRAFLPRLRLMFDMIPMVIRYVYFTAKQWYNGDGVFINVFSQLHHNRFTGVPLGGIGSGSIGTDFRGAFNAFSLIPGIKEQWVGNIKANQFILTVMSEDESTCIYQSLLSVADFHDSSLSEWRSNFDPKDVRYRGLFPRAWREFRIPDLDLILICEQVSPVMPHNYEDSSLPVGNFHWTAINNSKKNYSVAITFTFRNGTGNPKWDREGECKVRDLKTNSAKGLALSHTIDSTPVTYSVAVEQAEGSEMFTFTFNPRSKSGRKLWQSLQKKDSSGDNNTGGAELGIAVTTRFQLLSLQSHTTKFCLVWHMPVARFGAKSRPYRRWYTRFVGTDDNAVEKLVEIAMTSSDRWRTEIVKWQSPVVEDDSLPAWYRSALFNETYYVVDGASVWFDYDPSWTEMEPEMSPLTAAHLQKFGRFGYMESWEYLMFNTYDVHFYASWALLKNWPQLELSLQLEFCDQLSRGDNKQAVCLKSGKTMEMKTISRIPHDMGPPFGEPWAKTNAYILHDTADWRDLNLKFVLSCWRDYRMIVEPLCDSEEAKKILEYSYTRCEIIVRNALREWDCDDDGMIENSGTADQTYDMWTMSGTSAYCGSLWLAALYCISCMAEKLGETKSQQYFIDLLEKAKQAFEKKLWNGRYFNFDESQSNSGLIMADQLCGIWAQTMTGDDCLLSEAQITSTLETIYSHNVKMFASGNMGPVNGMHESGKIDLSSIQSEEVWTGTAYSLASFMIAKGKRSEGLDTARGMFETCWNRLGLQFQTPEAVYEKKYYRAIGYMRPLAVWAMQHALEIEASK
ncbi:hypothetical protein Q1695_002058 [Nippostrongylus brasiliensis]|nr:hypothetical protein Q1695_002058 [Nippostrongylus brasiliensis]